MNEQASLRQEATFEQAVMVVRLVLCALALVLVTADSLSAARGISFPALIWPAFMFITVAAWALGAWRISRSFRPGRETVLHYALHAGDTAGAVGLAYAIGVASPGSSWVILTVPIVIASVRFNSRAVIATWCGASTGYAITDRLWPTHFGIEASGLVEQAGLLLAVAASVALMTRWLEEGWRAQAEITLEAERARDQLEVIQRASQSMRVGRASQVLEVTASAAVSLGFDACVVSSNGATTAVAGDALFVPTGVETDPGTATGTPTGVELTAWSNADNECCHSAAVIEPRSGAVVTGWKQAPILESQARSLASLVAHASTNIEAARHLENARFAASRDPLTRVANRSTIQSFIDRDQPTEAPFVGAIFIDLDHFKDVNDTYGHAVGDQLLVSIAQRIEGIVERTALTGRYGGDEFIVLGDIVDPSALVATAHRIREKLAEPHALDGVEIHSSASIGVAVAPHANRGHLLEWADQAAYEAKRNGRNRIVVRRSETDARYCDDAAGSQQSIPQRVELPNA